MQEPAGMKPWGIFSNQNLAYLVTAPCPNGAPWRASCPWLCAFACVCQFRGLDSTLGSGRVGVAWTSYDDGDDEIAGITTPKISTAGSSAGRHCGSQLHDEVLSAHSCCLCCGQRAGCGEWPAGFGRAHGGSRLGIFRSSACCTPSPCPAPILHPTTPHSRQPAPHPSGPSY